MDFFSFLFWSFVVSTVGGIVYKLLKLKSDERLEQLEWENELAARKRVHNQLKEQAAFDVAPRHDDSGDSGVKSNSSVLGSTDASYESSSKKTRLFEFDSN